jgi:hypothetical protein
MEASAFWNRLDIPGSDVCRLVRVGTGWRLEGFAAFFDGRPVGIHYAVDATSGWLSRSARMRCLIAGGEQSVVIAHSKGAWLLDGEPVTGLDGCVDVDLGFTPATNLLAVGRLSLGASESASMASAWYDVSSGSLRRLDQSYRRIDETRYAYAAPSLGYEATLEFGLDGFVNHYPGLWERA